MNLRETGWKVVECMHLAQDRSSEYGNKTAGSIMIGNLLTTSVTIRFSRRALLHVVSYCGSPSEGQEESLLKYKCHA